MSNLELAACKALATGWSCKARKLEAGSLNIQLNAKLGQPDLLHFHHPSARPYKRKSSSQLRWQKRRHHAAKMYIEEAKSTQNICAEYIATSNKAEKPKESFLEYEDPQ